MSVNTPNIFSNMTYLPRGPLKAPLAADAVVIIDEGAAWHDTGLPPPLAERRSPAKTARIFVRIEDLKVAEDALDMLLSQEIEGLVLADCKGPAHLQRLDMLLRVAEAKVGLEDGGTRIIAEFGGALEAFLPPRALATASRRLVAVLFNEQAACDATGIAPSQAGEAGSPVASMRASTLLMAAEARLPAYLLAGETANAEGFSGRISHPAQDAERR